MRLTCQPLCMTPTLLNFRHLRMNYMLHRMPQIIKTPTTITTNISRQIHRHEVNRCIKYSNYIIINCKKIIKIERVISINLITLLYITIKMRKASVSIVMLMIIMLMTHRPICTMCLINNTKSKTHKMEIENKMKKQ